MPLLVFAMAVIAVAGERLRLKIPDSEQLSTQLSRRLVEFPFEGVSRTCSNKFTQFYDTAYLGCRTCSASLSATNQVPTASLCDTNSDINSPCFGLKVPDVSVEGVVGYPTTCSCQVGFIKQPIDCDSDVSSETCIDGFQCVRCPQASNRDHTECMQCSTTGPNPTEKFNPVTR